jgi:general stress protein YciG
MPEKKTATEIDISEAARIMRRKGGKIGGKSKSPDKQKSSRENGKKGGRPKSGKQSDI